MPLPRPGCLRSGAAGCPQAAGREKSCRGRPGAAPRGGGGCDPARVPPLLAAARGRTGAAADRPRRAWDGLSPGPGPEALGHVVLQVLFSLPLRCFSDCGCRCVRVRKYRHQRLSFFPAEQPQKRSSSSPLQPPPARGGQGGPVPVPRAGWSLSPRRGCALPTRCPRRVARVRAGTPGSPSPPTRVRVCAQGSAPRCDAPPPRVRTGCQDSSPFPSPGAAGLVLAEPPPTRFVCPPSLLGATRPRLPNARGGETLAQNPPIVNREKAEGEPPPSGRGRRRAGQRRFCRSQGG